MLTPNAPWPLYCQLYDEVTTLTEVRNVGRSLLVGEMLGLFPQCFGDRESMVVWRRSKECGAYDRVCQVHTGLSSVESGEG